MFHMERYLVWRESYFVCFCNFELYSKKVRLSPHQISFHVRHPLDTFILVLDARHSLLKLYEGKDVLELAACGLSLDACCEGLEACRLKLESLGA